MSNAPDVLVGVNPGDVLAGKYRVERLLGVGGMGVVVSAHHMQLDERVALKFLRPEALENPEAVARFDREARAAVKIKSEHVARVSDVGRLDNGAPYMVMEYLEGRDLGAWIHERGALPVEQATEFVLQACEAIADAHALGIIHRDLKPANLFCIVRSDGMMSIKVLDFGISKLTGLSASRPELSMTRTQSLMGSPLYMSPEQLKATKAVDARADIWALGIILYELATGQVPFTGEGIPDLVLNIVTTPTPPMRALRPDVPALFEQVVGRCLQKDREHRFANVAELAEALAPLAPRRALGSVERIGRILQNAGMASSSTRPVAVAAQTGGAQAAHTGGTMASWGQTAPGTGRRATAAVLGVLGTIALGGLIAVGIVARGYARKTAASAAPPSGLVAPLPAPSSPSASATTPAAASAESPPEAKLTDLVAPSPSAAPSASSSAVPSATAAPPGAVAGAAPTATPRPAFTAPAAGHAWGGARPPVAPAKPVCSAVPYLDSEGNTHFKQVCK